MFKLGGIKIKVKFNSTVIGLSLLKNAYEISILPPILVAFMLHQKGAVREHTI